MIELKSWDKGHKSQYIKAFALEKGDSSKADFSKPDFIYALKKASRRVSLPEKERSKT